MTERHAAYRTEAQRQIAKAEREKWEYALLTQIKIGGLPEPDCQVKWHPVRDWIVDFIYREKRILIEVQGAVWKQGRHTRGTGYIDDCHKLAEANLLGWRYFWFTPDMIIDGSALQYIHFALNNGKGNHD